MAPRFSCQIRVYYVVNVCTPNEMTFHKRKRLQVSGRILSSNYPEWPDITCRNYNLTWLETFTGVCLCVCECRFVVVLRYAKYWNATGFQGIVSIGSHCFIRGPESLSGCAVVQNSKTLLWTSVFLILCMYIFNDCFQVAAFLDKGKHGITLLSLDWYFGLWTLQKLGNAHPHPIQNAG